MYVPKLPPAVFDMMLQSEEAEEQERGDEEGGRGEGAGAREAGKEAANGQR